MKIRSCCIVLLTVLAALSLPVTAYAHGAKIEYTVVTTIEKIDIIAKFDSGEPMAEAQISVYAPNNTSVPWLAGMCDEQGRFSFTPDTSIPGRWDVQVRQAGHGHMIYIDITEGSVSGGGSSGYSTAQIVIMAACVVWGVIGTALYFSNRRKT